MLFERQLVLKLDLAYAAIQIGRGPLSAAAITAEKSSSSRMGDQDSLTDFSDFVTTLLVPHSLDI